MNGHFTQKSDTFGDPMLIVLHCVGPHMWASDVLRKETIYGINVSPALAHLFDWAGDQDQDPNTLHSNGRRVRNELVSVIMWSLLASPWTCARDCTLSRSRYWWAFGLEISLSCKWFRLMPELAIPTWPCALCASSCQ